MVVPLLRNEIEYYIDSSKELINLATRSHKCGYHSATDYFLKRSQKDCLDATQLSIELNKVVEYNYSPRQIIYVFLSFKEMEMRKLSRIRHLQDRFSNKDLPSVETLLHRLRYEQEKELMVLRSMFSKMSKVIPPNHLDHLDNILVR